MPPRKDGQCVDSTCLPRNSRSTNQSRFHSTINQVRILLY